MTAITAKKVKSPPGPAGIARIQYLQRLRQNPLTTMQELATAYGDIVHIGLGPYQLYFLNHPDFLHEILVRQAEIMRKPRRLSRPIADFLGNGLLISHGHYWKQQRRLIQPAFHHRYVQSYGEAMVASVHEQLATWTNNAIYDVDHEFMKMTLQMVTRTLFGSDITANTDSIANAVKILQRIAYDQGQYLLPLPNWVPLPAHRTKRHVIRLLDQVVMQIIKERRESDYESDNLLDMLLNAEDDLGHSLTDQQIRDEVMTVLLAGHESTANAISWMSYLLAQHPAVQHKLTAELNQVLNGRSPTIKDLKNLPYNAMIVKEALRLYPPAWALPRETTENIHIGGYPVGKGSLLFGIPFVIQRDPRFFDKPEMFRPERFENNFEKQLPRHVYIPFGGGPRFCVGNTFALMAMQLTLATIHQRFYLRLIEDQEIVLDPLLTLRPRYGLQMQVERRS